MATKLIAVDGEEFFGNIVYLRVPAEWADKQITRWICHQIGWRHIEDDEEIDEEDFTTVWHPETADLPHWLELPDGVTADDVYGDWFKERFGNCDSEK